MRAVAMRHQLGLVGSTGTTMLLIVAALVVLGVVMVAITVWLVRSTRTDHTALGPLEVMGDRSFRRADEEGRGTRLATARPPGAPPPAPIVPVDDETEVQAEVEVEGAPAPDEPSELAQLAVQPEPVAELPPPELPSPERPATDGADEVGQVNDLNDVGGEQPVPSATTAPGEGDQQR